MGLTESFCYDNLYRLDHSTLTGSCSGTTNLQLAYDAMGNITSKNYPAEGMTGQTWTYHGTKKHAVLSAGPESFAYDANGNASSRNGYAVGWTSYNYLSSVSGPSESASFAYGPDRLRWQMVYAGGGTSETTYYIGGLLEKVTSGSTVDYRHYIYAGDRAVAVYSRKSTGTNTLTYMLSDHQGSVETLATSAGLTLANESFTAYGNRRSAATWTGTPADRATLDGVSREGYTFQTVLGSLGLNHMNGRVQDAVTGRFLSSDPVIGDMGDTQSFNGYTYANNNPLTLADPSGFSVQDCNFSSHCGDHPVRCDQMEDDCIDCGGVGCDRRSPWDWPSLDDMQFEGVDGYDVKSYCSNCVEDEGEQIDEIVVLGSRASGGGYTGRGADDLLEGLFGGLMRSATSFGDCFLQIAGYSCDLRGFLSRGGSFAGQAGLQLAGGPLVGRVGGKVAGAIFSVGNAARGAASAANVANKVNHIFREGKNLEGLVRISGSPETAYRGVQEAANAALRNGILKPDANGILLGAGNGAILNVNGVNVQLIGGRVIDGVVQIGSFVGVP